MRFKIFLIFIFLAFTNNSLASIRIGIDCQNLTNQLGGLSKINLLWLESYDEKKYQLALINKKKNSYDKKFYLCVNKNNINTTSDDTLSVLSQRKLELITTSSIELFTEIISLTSKNSRKYIMQTLNLNDFDIDRNELDQAYIAGLMKLNEKLYTAKEAKETETLKKNKSNKKDWRDEFQLVQTKEDNSNDITKIAEWSSLEDLENEKNGKFHSIKIHHVSSGINYWKEFNNLDLNTNAKIAKEHCEYSEKKRLNRSYAKCNLKTVVALSSNGEKLYFNISDQSDLYVLAEKFNNQFQKKNNVASNQNLKNFNWHALVKHPKTNKEFIATNVSNEKDAKKIALSKCYDFVTDELSKIGYNDCYVDLTVDGNIYYNVAQDLINRQNDNVVLAKVETNDLTSLGNLVDFNLTFKETIRINGKQYQIGVVTDNLTTDGSERKYFDIVYLKNQKPTDRYFINYYEDGSKEYIELQNVNETKRYWIHDMPSSTSDTWYEQRSLFVDNELLIGKYINRSDGKELFGIFNIENKKASDLGSWEVWGSSINNLSSDFKFTNKVKKQKFNFAKFHYERSQETLAKLVKIEAELKKEVLGGKLNKFAKENSAIQNNKVAKKEPEKEEFKPNLENLDTNKPPKLIVKNSYTFKNSSYEIKGKFEDEHDSVFIEVDGRIIQAKDGKFSIQRFSPVDEEIKLVAIDKWGKKSEPQIVKIKIDMEETIVAENIEPLNPNNIKGRSNNNKVALIIGIENYSDTPQASYANLDAKYFYEYSKKAFGVKPSNIKLLVDEEATFIQTSKALTKWLNGKVKKNRSDLIIFFAGHGLASTDGKELYLLPQDSDPDLLSRTALSRTELFKEIMALSPKSVTMFLDTCFSGISRDEKTLLASARPIRIVADENDDIPGNFTIFSASQLDQISSGLKEAEHGIFSYYLMKGLEGKADQNNDRKITNGELLAYMDENISQKASELGRKQNPSLAGDPDKVLISYN